MSQEGYGESRNSDFEYAREAERGAREHQYPDEAYVEPGDELSPGYEGFHSFPDDRVRDEVNQEHGSEQLLDPEAQLTRMLEQKVDARIRGDEEEVDRIEKMIVLHATRHGISYGN